MTIRYFQDLPGIQTLDGLMAWCRREISAGYFEASIPKSELQRFWVLAGGSSSQSSNELSFAIRAPALGPNTVRYTLRQYDGDVAPDTQAPAADTTARICSCDGPTMWRHPTGCKCGWSQQNRRAK
jgi:hypothetical protein